MADDLFSIKNEFYLGNYGGAINEAQSGDLELSSANDERDRDVIVRVHARAPPAPGARRSSSCYCSRCAQDRPAYFRLPPLSDLPGSQAQTSPTACVKDDAEPRPVMRVLLCADLPVIHCARPVRYRAGRDQGRCPDCPPGREASGHLQVKAGHEGHGADDDQGMARRLLHRQ